MIRKHVISFGHAFRGIWTATRTQPNLRVHFVFICLVAIAGVYYQIPADQAVDLLLIISMVVLAEMGNTALEFLGNAVTQEYKEEIKHAKDISSGAVLLTAIFAVLVGLIIFIPHIIRI